MSAPPKGWRRADTDTILRRAGFPENEIAGMDAEQKKAALAEAIRYGTMAGADDEEGTRHAPITVESAADLDRAAARAHPDPSPAQADAENYRHGHIEIPELGLSGAHGVSIETAAGGTRNGPVDAKTGKPAWSAKMGAAYGRIKGTRGADDENLDIFVGPHQHQKSHVLVIDQKHPESGRFDEHKILAAFHKPSDAIKAYLDSHDDKGADRIGGLRIMTADEFSDWLKGDATHPTSEAMSAAQRKSDAAHRKNIEREIRKTGADPARLDADDIDRATKIHADEGAAPDDAFMAAVFRALVKDGHISRDDLREELGDEEADRVLDAIGASRHDDAAAPAGAGSGRAPAAPARGVAQGGRKAGAGPRPKDQKAGSGKTGDSQP